MIRAHDLVAALCGVTVVGMSTARAQFLSLSGEPDQQHGLPLQSPRTNVWVHGVGEGFSSSATSFGASAGVLWGLSIFGTKEEHDLAMGSFTYGHMLSDVKGEGRWYRGNFEFRGELFAGSQFSPEGEWFVGLTPHLRYDFATGSRWVPFADIGAGVTATSIGPPDLSGTFEFNLQAGGGVHWFVKDNMAITLDARCVHWSCAGIHHPNLGVNGITTLIGVTFFF